MLERGERSLDCVTRLPALGDTGGAGCGTRFGLGEQRARLGRSRLKLGKLAHPLVKGRQRRLQRRGVLLARRHDLLGGLAFVAGVARFVERAPSLSGSALARLRGIGVG